MTTPQPTPDAQIAGLVFAMVLIDENGTIAQANYAAENLLGISLKRLQGKNFFDFIGPIEPRVEARLLQPEVPLIARDLTIMASRICLLYTSPSPRDRTRSRMPSSA